MTPKKNDKLISMSNKMKKPLIIKILLLISSLGLVDAVYLTYIHFAKQSAVCSANTKLSNCNAVLQSSYANVGPIPTAFLGVIHYLFLIGILLFVLRSARKTAIPILFAQVIIGTLASVYFVYLQIWVIKSICLFCMLSAIINFLLLATLLSFFKKEVTRSPVYWTKIVYRLFIKPFFFLLNPEQIHRLITLFGEGLGQLSVAKGFLKLIFKSNKPILRQKIAGVNFNSPIGLAAGFDHEARLTQILPSLGFGFQAIGSITHKPYAGNPRPRLGRLPRSKSLMVNKGLQNKGTAKVINKLKKLKFDIPLGISVAKTNSQQASSPQKGLKDYLKSFKLLKKANLGDYYELNISCPNAFGGEPFTTPKKLDRLLAAIDKLKLKKPLFIKMPVDFSCQQTDKLCQIIIQHKVQGVILGNLSKDRKNPALDQKEAKRFSVGNFSGKPTEARSNRLIAFVYRKYHPQLTIIGCGGVFSTKDAYRKIKLGASLVQLITGLIYQGPQLVSQINLELADQLEKDGWKNIKEAVGGENSAKK